MLECIQSEEGVLAFGERLNFLLSLFELLISAKLNGIFLHFSLSDAANGEALLIKIVLKLCSANSDLHIEAKQLYDSTKYLESLKKFKPFETFFNNPAPLYSLLEQEYMYQLKKK